MTERVNIAKNVGKRSWLGRTLPALIYHTKAVLPNKSALVQWQDGNWKPYSTDDFIDASEELALGLLQVGLEPGDRVALFLESDVYFCLADMGCLMAGLVNVPIYLTHSPESIQFVLGHADAHAIIVSDRSKLGELAEVFQTDSAVHTVILVNSEGETESNKNDQASSQLPSSITVRTMSDVRELGKAKLNADSEIGRELSDKLDPSDLATIIYTSGTTGRPKGVMLTHENISSNALMAYEGMVGYRSGEGGETMLSFLPLTHVFARTLYYGALAHGTSIYFSHPDRLVEDLADVKPTILPTVPRVLEKVYARIIARTDAMGGLSGKIARWGLNRAQKADKSERGVAHKTADQFVYKKWRTILGGNIRFVISGGAALNGEMAEVFRRAGIEILQGYGLTETSPVIAFNRPNANRLGTVGQPLESVEVKIADDGEILTRGPHIMAGYFRDPDRTSEVIGKGGWFHTGDIGTLSEDGFLTITDRKKDLFKLSTGKYVMPQPLENKLAAEPLIDQTVVMGDGHKFASALIFPNKEHLGILAKTLGIGSATKLEDLCKEKGIIRHVSALVERANEGSPHWSTIKRFVIVPGELTVENDLLTPTLKVKRAAVKAKFSAEIKELYADENEDDLTDEKL